jgi:uncharacterized protein (DUF2252 family)
MTSTSSRYPTREERLKVGRSARSKASRVGQAEWTAASRKYNLVELILASERGRLEKLLPIKHQRMSVSPFSFYRGAVPLMAADLSHLPCTGLIAQLCGDAHVHNLGSYTAPDGRIIFDLNDFDETIPGPFEWDVKRMAVSLVLGGRVAGDSDRLCKEAVLEFVRTYREAMRKFSRMAVIDLARFQVSRVLKGSPVALVMQKAQRATNLESLTKLTVVRKGRHYLREEKPLQYSVPPGHRRKVQQAIHDYSLTLMPERRHFFSQYHVEHVAFRVVGCGSVGMRDYVALMLGNDANDPLFLQVKEATRSAYASYLPDARVPENQGERVAEGQRAMQMQSDIFLGWTQMDGRDYLVRQLRDHKAGIEDDELRRNGLQEYARVCGELLAKGHARSGDPIAMYGYMGNSPKFDKAIVKFALAYADQTDTDFEDFSRAMRSRKTSKS